MELMLSEQERQLVHGFRWKDRENYFFKPCDMSTHHLFYTLRMIWNHTMPQGARFPNYRKYTFGKFYTEQYLTTAIRALALELSKRDDMNAIMKLELQQMINWLKRNQIESKGLPCLS